MEAVEEDSNTKAVRSVANDYLQQINPGSAITNGSDPKMVACAVDALAGKPMDLSALAKNTKSRFPKMVIKAAEKGEITFSNEQISNMLERFDNNKLNSVERGILKAWAQNIDAGNPMAKAAKEYLTSGITARSGRETVKQAVNMLQGKDVSVDKIDPKSKLISIFRNYSPPLIKKCKKIQEST